MNKFRKGQAVERWVGEELEKIGFKVLVYGFRSYFGEIDMICVDEECLVLVEVKARTSTKFGQPYEAVNVRKLEKIGRTEEMFRMQWSANERRPPLPEASRVDVASVMLNSDGSVKNWELMRNVMG
jgi:Holliday junction resolvase-like predicted endonuclease